MLLSDSLAGPGLSGSAQPSRLCQGCSHPPRHRPAQAASAPPSCCDKTTVGVSHLHSNLSASRRTHDLRHTAASLRLTAGADPKVVQRVLGHATTAMTMDLYGHLVDASLWQAARLIGGTTGASERLQGRIRTESEPGRNAKNP